MQICLHLRPQLPSHELRRRVWVGRLTGSLRNGTINSWRAFSSLAKQDEVIKQIRQDDQSKAARGIHEVDGSQIQNVVIERKWRADQQALPEQVEDSKNDRRTQREEEETTDSVIQVNPLAPQEEVDTTPSQPISSTLPQPSQLRPTLHDRLRTALLAQHASQSSRKPPDKLQDSLATSPFATAFAQSSFAHALAVPVREDAFSRTHQPMSCLLSFHITELDADPDTAAPASGKKVGRKGSRRVAAPEGISYSLLPLSLARELMPDHQRHPQQNEAEDAHASPHKGTPESYHPVGTASYLTPTYSALRFISADPRRRVPSFALSRRMQAELGASKTMDVSLIQWRPDMPDFVLGVLRRIVLKKLGYLLSSKGLRDKRGLVYEVVGGGQDLRRLGEMRDVSCVVQLAEDVSENVERGNSMERVDSTLVSEEQVEWEDYTFLNDIRSVVPLSRSKQTSTIPYRNTHIPIYSLPRLLGTELATKIVQGTVFAAGGKTGKEEETMDSGDVSPRQTTKYVVLARSTGTIQAQTWLEKLWVFLDEDEAEMAEDKEE